MAPRLLPLLLLLLLLAGPPAVRPAPPTCYSRMLSLSREITGDFQSLQAMEPLVSPLRPAGDQEVQRRPGSLKRAFARGNKKNAVFLFWSRPISWVFVF